MKAKRNIQIYLYIIKLDGKNISLNSHDSLDVVALRIDYTVELVEFRSQNHWKKGYNQHDIAYT